MASIITATTANGLVSSADNSGVLQLASGTGNLVTVPSVTGTAMVSGNMPAFSAYLGTTQSISSGTNTKLQANTEEFDTNSNYDNATNYRFTPTVAGYYQISGQININSTAYSLTQAIIYKNGNIFKRGNVVSYTSSIGNALGCSAVSALIYFNGSTDYVELYGSCTGTSPTFTANIPNDNYFQGVLVRAA